MEERERERVQAAPGGRPSPSAAQARRLVALARERGAEAVPALRAFLRHRDPWVRLHAVQGLATIDDADARAGLIGALHDDNFGVHQAAARALAGAGRTATVAVLEALVRDQPSTGFLHGAAHVLKHARLTPEDRAAVAPVVDAFRQAAADLEVPLAAFAALDRLRAPGAAGTAPSVRRYVAGRRKGTRMEGLTPAALNRREAT